MMSKTGYGLCNECAKDQYLVNSTSCTSCPDGQLTRGTGAIDNSLCLSKVYICFIIFGFHENAHQTDT